MDSPRFLKPDAVTRRVRRYIPKIRVADRPIGVEGVDPNTCFVVDEHRMIDNCVVELPCPAVLRARIAGAVVGIVDKNAAIEILKRNILEPEALAGARRLCAAFNIPSPHALDA